jgi:transcriptional regulator NrdR family protein
MGQGKSKAKEGGTKRVKIPPQFSPKRGLIQCKTCTRNFAPNRIETHLNICIQKSSKRKPFDMKKARVEGTEAAEFVEKKTVIRKKKVRKSNNINNIFCKLWCLP